MWHDLMLVRGKEQRIAVLQGKPVTAQPMPRNHITQLVSLEALLRPL
jgi:hypothetical protein